MTNKSIDILNERLAKGEITLEQYNSLRNTIINSTSDSFTDAASSDSQKPEYVVIDKINYQAPSNYSPIVFNNKLSVAGNHFIYKGKKFLFKDISHIIFDVSKTTFNFVPTTNVTLSVSCNEQEIFSINSTGTLINRKKRINMIVCGIYLSSRTRESRYENALFSLRTNKFIDIDGIRFSSNGDVSKGDKTLNILSERDEVDIEFGRVIGGSHYFTSNNPDYVKIVSKRKSGIFKDKITFSRTTNKDITKRIIYTIRSGKLK